MNTIQRKSRKKERQNFDTKEEQMQGKKENEENKLGDLNQFEYIYIFLSRNTVKEKCDAYLREYEIRSKRR